MARHRRELWTAGIIARLGTVQDTDLARELGISASAVSRRRREAGVLPAKPPAEEPGKSWPQWAIESLGKMTDAALAKKTRDHSNGSAAHAPQVRGRGIASKIRQPASSEEKMTLMQAVRYFADRDVCEKYMRSIKWPNDITCPDCGAGGDRIGEVKTRHLLRCKDCRRQISAKVGTIFESSALGLDKWFVAVWCTANCNGISSHELARALGVRQPSAWFLLHRIRVAMECGGIDKFDGPGGAAKNMHAKKRREKIKPNGFDKFDYLARKLVTVPKDKVAGAANSCCTY